MRKKGITLVSASIMTVIILVLASTVTIAAYKSMENSNKIMFAIEISSIQEEVDKYYKNNSNDENPITSEMYDIDLTETTPQSIDEFEGEPKNDNKIKLYALDLKQLGINNTKFGIKLNENEKDIYLLSLETKKVYYMQGVKANGKTYYTLSEDLIKIKKRNEKIEETVTPITQDIQITTSDFTVVTNGVAKEIYLNDIKIIGENIKTAKYEIGKINNDDAKTYFSNNGKKLENNRIKMLEEGTITLYAEDIDGNYTIEHKGIPQIPYALYYVGGTIDTGTVISDNMLDANKGTSHSVAQTLQGNQFVWVPVEDFSEFIRYDFHNNTNLSTTYREIAPELGQNREVEKIYASVEKNKGFYVGRYEAGKPVVTPITDGTNKPIIKQGIDVWNNIPWGGSGTSSYDGFPGNDDANGVVKVARNLYSNNSYNTTGVVSHLIYGVQWDAIMRWYKNSGIDVQNSSEYGNHLGDGGLKKTGSSSNYQRKNIYDLAGNVSEFTMESTTSNTRTYRGRNYAYSSPGNPVSFRMAISFTSGFNYAGFRIALYIK